MENFLPGYMQDTRSHIYASNARQLSDYLRNKKNVSLNISPRLFRPFHPIPSVHLHALALSVLFYPTAYTAYSSPGAKL